MKKILAVIIAVLVVIAGSVFIIGYHLATKLPQNSPAAFILMKRPPDKKVVVCIGVSITHGAVSCNYVDILSERLTSRGFVFENAGINSEMAYNVLQ